MSQAVLSTKMLQPYGQVVAYATTPGGQKGKFNKDAESCSGKQPVFGNSALRFFQMNFCL